VYSFGGSSMSRLKQRRLVCSSKLIILFIVLLAASGSTFAQVNPSVADVKSYELVAAPVITTLATPENNNVNSQNNVGKTITVTSDIKLETKRVGVKGDQMTGTESKADIKKDSDSTAVEDRMKVLEEAMRAQNAKIEKMSRIIDEQQQTIEQLSGKSNGANINRQTDVAISVASSLKAAENSAGGNSQTQTLDERVKKVEEQVLKIGPIRFNGDFRLRFDGIFRKADPNPPAGFSGTSLLQNVRARYRLRLNMDTDVSKTLSFHGQLATGPVNNPLTNDQDFSSTVARQPFFINEAWIDYHPNKSIQLQGGRLQEVFADNSRFLFDDDVRFNGFNEKYVLNLKGAPAGLTSVEFRAGQYIFSNPNVAIVTAGSPLAQASAVVGTIGRSSNLFHQGVLFNEKINKKFTQQFGVDLQLYRNPNQIQLASTANGAVLIVYPGLGITLSGPLSGTGNATTTAGGAIYTARNFQIGRFTYRLNYAGFKYGERTLPVTFNFQTAHNFGTGQSERDAYLAALQIGKVAKRGDFAFLYIYAQKGANALISQLTDDDLGTGSGVNIRTNHFRFDYGLSKKVSLQTLLYIQTELRSSGDFPNFFVPLNAFTPRQFRFQEQIVFTF